MNEKNRLQMISDLADWIDKEILAESLMEYLEDAYCLYNIENEVTLPMLKEFYLRLLEEFGENAKYFVEVRKERGELKEKTLAERYVLRSKKYGHYLDRDYWWYLLSNGAKRYIEGDIILFKLEDFSDGKTGTFELRFESIWKSRILSATRQSNNSIQVKIWKYRDYPEVKIYFGRVTDGEYTIEVQVE